MATHYFELRKDSMHGSLSTDMMRHLHTRQHLGKVVVICEQPAVMLSAARKQWLKLSRSVQKKRAGTLNADKILKYTHAVTHMQHMRFTAKSPFDEPDADVYFLSSGLLEVIPANCLSVYMATRPSEKQLDALLAQLPDGALLVDYIRVTAWSSVGLEPKQVLEERMRIHWDELQKFLTAYHIDLSRLADGVPGNLERMEEALDVLLGANHKFLQIAGGFQRALELARPLRLSKDIRQQYDAAILLAHRVQALTPGAFTQSFLETYSEDDTFFLYDSSRDISLLLGQNLSEAIARHIRANRPHLAAALKHYYLAG